MEVLAQEDYRIFVWAAYALATFALCVVSAETLASLRKSKARLDELQKDGDEA